MVAETSIIAKIANALIEPVQKEDVLIAAEPIITVGAAGLHLFWPKDDQGAWTASDLRIIADHLDELNKERE